MIGAILEIILFSAAIFSGAYAIVSTLILAYELYFNNRNKARPTNLPAISILKPLKGLDDQLEINLRSFFHLDYPDYEIVFGVAESSDPAIAVVHRLQEQYPQIKSHLVIDGRIRSLNPKINNLRNIMAAANHNYLLISDSNIRVGAGYLVDMMRHLQKPNVGLVTSTIRGISAGTTAGVFENLHLNTFVASSVFAVRRLFRVPVVIGKSMLFSRQTLHRIGGFESFGEFLAEDQLIGLAVRELGYSIRTSTHFVDNVNESWNWERLLNRHIRWAKMRRNLHLPNYISEILSHPLALTVAYAALRQDDRGLQMLAAVMTVKYFCDILALFLMRSDLRIWHCLLLPLKDAIIFGVWFVPFFSRSISWRGNRYTINKRTLLTHRPVVADEPA